MAEFYLDHNIANNALQIELRQLRHFVVTAHRVGRHADPDSEQLLFAAQNRLVLVTRNTAHFAILQSAWIRWPAAWGYRPLPKHAGILAIRQQPHRSFPDIALALHQMVTAPPTGGLVNRMHFWDTVTGGWLLDWEGLR